MCLVSRTNIPTKSSYNIICYKVLCLDGGKLVSPYQGFAFNIGTLYKDEKVKQIMVALGVYLIESGFFHSYKDINSAKTCISHLQSRNRKLHIKAQTYKIFKAEIPEGTEFFEGQYGDIASKSLKIIEECFD